METGKTDTRSRMDLPDGCWLEMECNRKIYEKQGKQNKKRVKFIKYRFT